MEKDKGDDYVSEGLRRGYRDSLLYFLFIASKEVVQ